MRLDHNATGSEADSERLGAARIVADFGAVVVVPQALGDDNCQVRVVCAVCVAIREGIEAESSCRGH